AQADGAGARAAGLDEVRVNQGRAAAQGQADRILAVAGADLEVVADQRTGPVVAADTADVRRRAGHRSEDRGIAGNRAAAGDARAGIDAAIHAVVVAVRALEAARDAHVVVDPGMAIAECAHAVGTRAHVR